MVDASHSLEIDSQFTPWLLFVCLNSQQVLQQPDERVAGGRTARQQALEALALKYCTNRGGGPRSSVQVEQEMLAHIAAAERRSKLLEGQLKEVGGGW